MRSATGTDPTGSSEPPDFLLPADPGHLHGHAYPAQHPPQQWPADCDGLDSPGWHGLATPLREAAPDSQAIVGGGDRETPVTEHCPDRGQNGAEHRGERGGYGDEPKVVVAGEEHDGNGDCQRNEPPLWTKQLGANQVGVRHRVDDALDGPASGCRLRLMRHPGFRGVWPTRDRQQSPA